VKWSDAGDPGGSDARRCEFWGEHMNQPLATAVRGEPADIVISGAAGAATTGVIAVPAVPVFVDASGRRRKLVTGFGWLVALACVAYLGVIGVSMTGTSVGPLPDLPSVASRSVVFGADTAGLPQGALEAPLPAPAQPAAAPNWGVGARVAATQAAPKLAPVVAPTAAPKTAVKTAQQTAPKTAVKTAPKMTVQTAPKTAVKTAPKVGASKTGIAAGQAAPSASGGASR
jgi:hypothetical protein